MHPGGVIQCETEMSHDEYPIHISYTYLTHISYFSYFVAHLDAENLYEKVDRQETA